MASNLVQVLAREFSLAPTQVENTLELFAGGATVPFAARYRKERTGGLNEVQLRALAERHAYLGELEDRKATIVASIAEQGKLSDDLKQRIARCATKSDLEDLYLPFRPKRRTRAAAAREKGLEPLAERLTTLNRPDAPAARLEAEAARYVGESVTRIEEALAGAADILAEAVAERAPLRAWVRDYLLKSGSFAARIKPGFPAGTTKFEMYRDYRTAVRNVAPHNLLALFRGETEGVLAVDLEFDERAVLDYLETREIRTREPALRRFWQQMLQDAFERLFQNSLTGEVRALKKQEADLASIQTFEANLRELLLASPAGHRPTLAIDPGFRTGCKVAVLGPTGTFIAYQAIFPHQGADRRAQAAGVLRELIVRHRIELIAVGNGTAGRETDAFVGEVIAALDPQPVKVMVSEAGASIYSASEVAAAEFPDLDVTVRGAISIGRRLQDPLAELVKIDPKSIGVGQYQHDVDQKLLKRKLDETVESCVNHVGVDLNTASAELLTFVSGIGAALARNIVAHRDTQGPFKNRRALLKVPKLGPKAFEQAAGFLRIRDGDNPLDNTAVHPESYPVVRAMASDLGISPGRIAEIPKHLQPADLSRYASPTVGEPTLRDILSELEKPGRDPRAAFQYATFKEGVNALKDLVVGMELEGVVTNVTNFGAFVDIGVHQDGLVHVSQLADRFVADPKAIVKVGQIVRVRVLEVNTALGRIGLSMRR
ncbi:Tex family protein [Gloeobacter morelensis]|uniref:RNA-binding transcriptional accessory protein n=1 Tax=Gloeobacter morelensis MG652769 TaxID=2781736 RepID=A0ABY3PL46_9CYAN|nr:Tex family protein [Gloeobacter morelensis]UFP94393.1 RNA-binding transcriptional accessory protein [Gloeobacter morelensis MG652769]